MAVATSTPSKSKKIGSGNDVPRLLPEATLLGFAVKTF
jgi:hypothetical protein